MSDATRLQGFAGGWHVARFPDAEEFNVVCKLIEEVGELGEALNARARPTSATHRNGDVEAEAADVVICLLVLLHRWHPGADLITAVERKLTLLATPGANHRSALAAGSTTGGTSA